TVPGAPDWRGLLDILEDKPGKRFDDLWRAWVVRDTEAPLLDARATARSDYNRLVADAGPWRLPGAIRAAMRGWQFDDATTLMAGARAVLARRTDVQSAAAAAGLALPNRLETAFESSDGVAAANDEADAELSTIQAIVAAANARPATTGPLEQLGLVGAAPGAQLVAARAAFTQGDLSAAARGAASARAAWAGASDAGLNRALAAAATLLLILLALVGVASSRRVARHRRGPQPAGPRPRLRRPSRNLRRGPRRRRPDRAEGGRPPDPRPLSRVRLVRDGVPRDAGAVDGLGDSRTRGGRCRGAAARRVIRCSTRPPRHRRRPRLRGDRGRLRGRLDAGRGAARRPQPDGHDAAFARVD